MGKGYLREPRTLVPHEQWYFHSTLCTGYMIFFTTVLILNWWYLRHTLTNIIFACLIFFSSLLVNDCKNSEKLIITMVQKKNPDIQLMNSCFLLISNFSLHQDVFLFRFLPSEPYRKTRPPCVPSFYRPSPPVSTNSLLILLKSRP